MQPGATIGVWMVPWPDAVDREVPFSDLCCGRSSIKRPPSLRQHLPARLGALSPRPGVHDDRHAPQRELGEREVGRRYETGSEEPHRACDGRRRAAAGRRRGARPALKSE